MKDFMFMQLQAMDHAPLSDAPELGRAGVGGGNMTEGRTKDHLKPLLFTSCAHILKIAFALRHAASARACARNTG